MGKKMYLMWSLFICVIGFSITSIMVMTNSSLGFDSGISAMIQSNHTMMLTKISKALAIIGGPKIEVMIAVSVAVAVAFFAVFFYCKSQIDKVRGVVLSVVVFATVNVATYFSNSIVKHLFQRHRPMTDSGSYSFPSNHAMMAVAFYLTAAYLLWEHIPSRIGRVLLILVCSTMAIAIGVSRIYLNRHYPTDIIAGFFASGLILSLVLLLYEKKQGAFRKNQ